MVLNSFLTAHPDDIIITTISTTIKKEKEMKTEKVGFLNEKIIEETGILILFPCFYGIMVALFPIFGWITGFMVGYKIKSQLYTKGFVCFLGILFISSICTTIFINQNIVITISIVILCSAGWILKK